jgi:triacylglycerol lipase
MNLIFVHGILGFREKFGIVEYFRDVAEHFRAEGFAVLVPELDPTRGIEFRGNQLGDQIDNGFNSKLLDPAQKTHIVAHSMGGLDSRYLLSPVSGKHLVAPVRSLTTISTPHQGSPIADLIDTPLDLLPFPHLPFGPAGNPLELALNELGISLDGLRDLTTASSQAFSAKYTDDPTVAYFSVAGSGRPGFVPTASSLLLFHHYILAKTGKANDGLVTTDSAQWGKFDRATWPADHAEEVGYNLDNVILPPAFPYLARFDQIVANVARL